MNTNVEIIKSYIKKRDQRAITLIALIITIILLLILSGVVLNITLGENGIFSQSKLAVEKYNEAKWNEDIELQNTANQISNLAIVSNRDGLSEDELKSYIQQQIQAQLKISINPSRVIAIIANDSSWGTTSHEYTATEDCVILGTVGTDMVDDTTGECTVWINDVYIGNIFSKSRFVGHPITYYISAGDKIEFKNKTGNTHMYIRAFALK